jgi:hypothetical protein
MLKFSSLRIDGSFGVVLMGEVEGTLKARWGGLALVNSSPEWHGTSLSYLTSAADFTSLHVS